MKCKNCKKEHNGTFGSGRFCCRSCANSRIHSEKTKSKIKNSINKYNEDKKIIRTCIICKKKRKVFVSNKKKVCCSKICLSKLKSENQIKRILDGKVINKSNTIPEIKFRNFLNKNKINYKFQYKIDRYLVDFYLPDLNLVYEVYGDYWHTNPKFYDEPKTKVQKFNKIRDKLKINYLKRKGYNIKIIWEDEIRNEDFKKLRSII